MPSVLTQRSLTRAFDRGEDLISGLGPHEGLRVAAREFGEEALDLIAYRTRFLGHWASRDRELQRSRFRCSAS